MSRAFPYVLLLALSLPLGAACGGDDDDDTGDDDSAGADAGDGEPDAGGDGPDASGACVPTDQLMDPYRPVTTVSDDAVTPTPGEVTEAVVDATAGGTKSAADNPYIYLDLVAGEKAEISDVDALDSADWDVAFKRSSIKSNGGDSGTGGVEVATVEAETLEEVTAEPAAEEFIVDDWLSDDCTFQGLDFGEPQTVFGLWYEYSGAPNHTLDPFARVYVVRTHTGDLVKLELVSYYDGEVPAVYSVRWAPL